MRRILKLSLVVAISLLAASPLLLLRPEAHPITPNEEFFEVYYSYQPRVIAEEWELSVMGLVERELVLDYGEVTALDNVTVTATLTCVTGGTGTARWRGVRVIDLLGAASVLEGAKEVVFHSADGYDTSLELEDIGEDVILAWEMNGGPLPREQGFPLRVVAPGQYGYKWAMWVEALEVVDEDHLGYWESRGWADDASLTLERDWFTHSFLFTVGAAMGLFAAASREGREGFLDRETHRFASMGYSFILVVTMAYWAWQTADLRGEVFYSTHGRLALGALVADLVGLAALPLGRRYRLGRTHCHACMASLVLFLSALVTGILLAFP